MAVQRLADRILDIPVEIATTGIDGAGVAASHGHNDIGSADGFVGERLGELASERDADLVKCGDDRRSHSISGGGARSADEHAITGKLSQDAGGELRSPGVLHADEEHFGNGVVSRFGPGERVKTERWRTRRFGTRAAGVGLSEDRSS